MNAENRAVGGGGDEALRELREYLVGHVGQEAEVSVDIAHGEATLECPVGAVPKVLAFLRDDVACAFTMLVDICGVDYPAQPKRFALVYHLLSMSLNQRIRVKAPVGEGETAPSVCDLFPCAAWFEREAYDMYGILFAGHPDLRRLLTDYGFEGYPLRKDFPLTGYVEARYDDDAKRVVYEPVVLEQAFRDFDFVSPWEGMGAPFQPGTFQPGDVSAKPPSGNGGKEGAA